MLGTIAPDQKSAPIADDQTGICSDAITPAEANCDYYFDRGLMVFSAAFLKRRGYCCGHECRHCPYREPRP